MIKNMFKIFTFTLLALSFTLTSCNDDDETNAMTENKVTYDLNELGNSGVNGTIEFLELSDGRIQAEIALSGTTNGNTHPAHVHANSAALGGGIIIPLESVAGATGSSVTIFDQLADGTSITFDMIDDLDAYVNIHLSANDLATVVAQGDIGSNLLTGTEQEYTLVEKAVPGISGKITFKERKNGFALAVINIDGTPDGGQHPAHIHMNRASEGGGILVSLTTVDGSTGMSNTDIRTTDSGDSFDYNDVLTANAYVNVHLSSTELGTIVAQGDIGLNELTGESVTYDLGEKDVAGINGDVLFEERKDGSMLATITLVGTPDGGIHPAHIHENSAEEGGPIAISFNAVDGTTGISTTSIRTLDSGESINFELIKTFDGYVNVHLSATELGTIVAQGNIGINS